MKVYVVTALPEASFSMVSQKGYTSLEKAQAFIEGQPDKPQKVSERLYQTGDLSMDYNIWEVDVV